METTTSETDYRPYLYTGTKMIGGAVVAMLLVMVFVGGGLEGFFEATGELELWDSFDNVQLMGVEGLGAYLVWGIGAGTAYYLRDSIPPYAD
ncbi:hypothetical protein BSZ35_00205 [Salinibacter sp. 10B]|uniref:hypothetical protein n=1 Tax=Salinibacter sp. 10B TaxID=1923971 RepID=UPI000CF51C12|nr:hypothetical protein [Salinibacter sp. 10B]PQJ36811.1 hypothetical protein BSZ35_00205 [Salinibacter sp. 10B]